MLKSTRSNRSVRIALVQMACQKDPKANFDKAVLRIQKAAAQGAKIICLQELFKTQYFCQTQDTAHFDLAEFVPGPGVERLSKLAKAKKVVIIAPLFEKRRNGVYHNTAVVLDADGKYVGQYRKMHIPQDPGFYEKYYFTPGDLGFKSFQTRYAKIGVLICWDQWFPEAARIVALQGADILFYPTAIGWRPKEKEETLQYHAAWQTAQRAHAISNGVYVAAVNRVGVEADLQFWGQSFVADPFGRVIKKAGPSKEEILLADCDLSQNDQIRREWPFLRDRRLDAYPEILKR